MLTRTLLLGAAASLALGATAKAADGWYISLEGGANWVDDWDQRFFTTNGTGVLTDTDADNVSFDTGWAVLASVGYGFGSGWRAEFEAGYRDNDSDVFLVSGAPAIASVDLSEVSLMLNVLYDIPLTKSVSFSLGAGAGADYAMYDLTAAAGNSQDEDWVFAYQGIAGVNYAVGQQTQLFIDYRYFRAVEPDFDFRPALPGYAHSDDLVKHTVTLGLRYSFGQPAPEPVVAPPPPPPPPAAPTTPREYIVFFGHNKSNLTNEALDVIRQAAAAAKEYGSASILVVGHADRSGSAKYNERLSLRRANAVKGALVSDGISEGAVTVSARGESDPMVPTADGVREPQNRRVHISL